MKRESVEGKVATYFQTAEAQEAVLMFKVIKSILNSRGFELDGRKVQKKPKTTKTPKSNSGISVHEEKNSGVLRTEKLAAETDRLT